MMLHRIALRYAPASAAICFCVAVLSMQTAIASGNPVAGPNWEWLATGALSLLAMVVSAFAAGWAKALDQQITDLELGAKEARDQLGLLQMKLLTDQQPLVTQLALVNQALTELARGQCETRQELAHLQQRLDGMRDEWRRRDTQPQHMREDNGL